MENAGNGIAGGVGGLIYIAFLVLMLVSAWKVYTKAGQPGWAIFIPIYNIIVFLKIVGKPWWWMFLFFIPVVNFIIAIILVVELAKVFGKGIGFAIGLLFLSFIFYPILGLGKAQYIGTDASME